MPVYNGQRYVKQAIQSLLAQTYSDFEIVVVDDGSTDQTAAIVKELATQDNRIRYFYQPNAGVVSARNLAIEKSRSDFVALLDSDDIAYPQRLERQLNFMLQNPDVLACGSYACQITGAGRPIGPWNLPCAHEEMVRHLASNRTAIINPSAIIRRKAFDRYGMYREDLVFGNEDFELWCRFARVGILANLPEELIKYRVLPSSLTSAYELQRQASSLEIADQFRISCGLNPKTKSLPQVNRFQNLAQQAMSNGKWMAFLELTFQQFGWIRGVRTASAGLVKILVGRSRVTVGALVRRGFRDRK
jgi:glycosyltransferase involved in cell wall biosynthesis